jgi:putative transposase
MSNQNTTEHRKKLQRFDIPGHAHELTFSCYHQRPYLKAPVVCTTFMEELAVAKTNFQFKIWAYVLMPDHVHLLIWPEVDNYKISLILQHIKGKASTRYRQWMLENAAGRYQKFVVPEKGREVFRLWQVGGGYDRNIEDAEGVHNAIRYIEMNPVKAGLVKTPEEWVWSSAHARMTGQGVVPDEEGLPILYG